MNLDEFKVSLADELPPQQLSVPVVALWWDAKGDWARAHKMVDELETIDGMTVHAYLHRKEGANENAEYWYRRVGRPFREIDPGAEWEAIAEELLQRD